MCPSHCETEDIDFRQYRTNEMLTMLSVQLVSPSMLMMMVMVVRTTSGHVDASDGGAEVTMEIPTQTTGKSKQDNLMEHVLIKSTVVCVCADTKLGRPAEDCVEVTHRHRPTLPWS